MIETLLLAASGTLCGVLPPAQSLGSYAELRSGIEVLHDPDRSFRFDQVAQPPLCATFVPATTYPRFGASHDGIWLRFRLQPAGRIDDWRLLVRFPALDHVCVHWPLTDGTSSEACSGLEARGDPASAWASGYLFRVPAALDTQQPVYLYADSGTLLKIPVVVGTMDAILRQTHRAQLGWGVFYGALLACVMLALVNWIGFRQPATLYYVLHLGAFALALAAWQGQWLEWGLPAAKSDRLGPLLSALFLASGARYYQLLLETRLYAPRLHQLFTLLMILSAGPALAAVFDPQTGNRLLAVIALPWVAAVLGASVVRMRQGLSTAKWVMLAVAPLLAAVGLKALEALGMAVVSPDVSNLMLRIAALAPPCVLTLAMALQMRDLMADRDRAARLAATHREMALYRSRYDELTNLPNRLKLRDDIAERIAPARAPRSLAVITLGLDHFRDINHVLGHEAGDAALRELATRLRAELQEADFLARLGPDIFGVVTALPVSDRPQSDVIADRCWQLQQRLHEPLTVGDGLKLSASIGVALFPEHGVTADVLLRHSEAALYFAKDTGGSALEVFRPEILQSAREHLTVAKDLRAAIQSGEMQLFYQPIVALGDGQLRGVEVLLRWVRPDGTVLSPEVFIPVAEAADLIDELTDWVLARSCGQLADWHARGVRVPRVAVNISARLFASGDLPLRVDRALGRAGIVGEGLELEITESALVENLDAAVDVLRQLRALRVGISMDDFGVGYSSLNYLRVLPLTTLKIDRSFLRGVPDDAEAAGLIRAMISMGRELRLKVVAEGIENSAQMDWLMAHGVLAGQGFLLSKALPAAEFETWLAAWELSKRSAA